MSTIILKKPYAGHKPGDIISVPFQKGRELVAADICQYPPQPAAKSRSASESNADAERIKALEARLANDAKEREALKKQLEELQKANAAKDPPKDPPKDPKK